MSRRDLIAFSDRYEIIVGWDAPLRSYFAQVEDLVLARQGEDDTLVVWVGTSYSEIIRPEDLRLHVEKYGILDDETVETLRGDRAATLDRSDSQLQRQMRTLMTRNETPDEEM